MACCLTAPSHYLNQCWIIITGVHRDSSQSNFTIDTSAISQLTASDVIHLCFREFLVSKAMKAHGFKYISIIRVSDFQLFSSIYGCHICMMQCQGISAQVISTNCSLNKHFNTLYTSICGYKNNSRITKLSNKVIKIIIKKNAIKNVANYLSLWWRNPGLFMLAGHLSSKYMKL